MVHLSASNPFSITAFEAAYREGEPWLECMLEYLQGTLSQAADYIAQQLPELRLVQPEGTYLLWLDCRRLDMDDDALKRFFVQRARVGLSPGTAFGAGGEGFMRMNIGSPRKVVMAALQRIRQALDERRQASST